MSRVANKSWLRIISVLCVLWLVRLCEAIYRERRIGLSVYLHLRFVCLYILGCVCVCVCDCSVSLCHPIESRKIGDSRARTFLPVERIDSHQLNRELKMRGGILILDWFDLFIIFFWLHDSFAAPKLILIQ